MSDDAEKRGKRRALIGDLPRGVSVFRDTSGKRSDGTKKAGYRVRLGKKFTGGRPKSAFVSDLSEAREWIAAQKPHAVVMQATRLTQGEISDAVAALSALREKNSPLGLADAVALALRHHSPEGGRRTVAEVSSEMQARAKSRGAKDTTLRQMKSLLSSFEMTFGARQVPSVSTVEVEGWIDEMEGAPRTKNNYLKQAAQLFGFAVRRRYLEYNPCDPLDLLMEDETNPEILDPEKMKLLLAAASEKAPRMVPFLALSAFGWLRRSEICVLPVSSWDKGTGTIHAGSDLAKTRINRFIPVNDSLRAWLEVADLRGKAWFTHSQIPDVVGDSLLRLAKIAGIEIPHNALRHSAISYALAAAPTKDGIPLPNSASKISEYAGNSEQVIVKAYRRPLSPDRAKGWWRILPG